LLLRCEGGSWKGFGSGAPCILGIDEAGRGPVLGPMVYGCAASPLDCENELKELGVADSKALTETKREEIFTNMCTNKSTMQIVAYALCCLSPQHISISMLRRRKCSLNEISHSAAISLIRDALSSNINVVEVSFSILFVVIVFVVGRWLTFWRFHQRDSHSEQHVTK
uniref:Ribonuclease n=1 Tax=Angiostrongylus cantonensis TaxID=6313 RepID=A0A0K0D5D0_ANGCA